MDLLLKIRCEMCACSGLMEIRERNSEKNKGFYFRCTVRGCRKEISVPAQLKIPFLKVPMHLFIATIVQFIYFWCRNNVKQDELQFQLDIGGRHTSWTGRTFKDTERTENY